MSDTERSNSEFVYDANQDDFAAQVFERSKNTPVVVDFWAAWCGPCRMLGPVLEKLADEYQGRFVLVKADTDQVPQAAAEFNVQSIPAVYAVVDEDVVDFFQGALPEDQLREWIDRVLGHAEVAGTARLEQSNPAEAEAKYRRFLDDDPQNTIAIIGLARVLLAQNQNEEARKLIEDLERRGFLEPEAEQLKAKLELESFEGGELNEISAAAEADPDDLALQLRLAEALAASERYQESMDVCLSIVQRDKVDAGDKAREIMVDIFRVLSDEDLVRQYRRKLSALLH